MTTRMLIGLDGRKMSTSWGNVINTIDSPDEQFGKVMSIRDELIGEYFEAATGISPEEVNAVKAELKKVTNPKYLKEKLAGEVVKRYHGEKAAIFAKENFEKLFSKNEIPENVPELTLKALPTTALLLVLASGVFKSNGEARRLIEQGGLDVDGVVLKDPAMAITPKNGMILKIGKKRFFKVKLG